MNEQEQPKIKKEDPEEIRHEKVMGRLRKLKKEWEEVEKVIKNAEQVLDDLIAAEEGKE
ncbi:hypothetical protein KKA93_01260 [Patescibacteria group bacterium]|nr:hypothetical protein [Patescibacteria group bacterium]MBU1663021.1 hypothetical protein [Patescibacteria group bacterium]MBU1933833.1 hypothetical protein [Patescibacteria group bacterium]MBU2007640.1 hypothetical protein [Patescibacteria group bacterium]MBU2233725.1 hypothetical protein [Patescibacteria group bacterium]